MKPLGFGMSAGFRLVWVECRKSVLVPVWFPPQQSVCAAGYDVCFVKVFLLEVFISGKRRIGSTVHISI